MGCCTFRFPDTSSFKSTNNSIKGTYANYKQHFVSHDPWENFLKTYGSVLAKHDPALQEYELHSFVHRALPKKLCIRSESLDFSSTICYIEDSRSCMLL